MVLKRIQKFKEKHGIGFSGSRAKRERLKIKQQEQGSRDVKNSRGRTTGKEYWNPLTKRWQKTPVKRGRNLPGGSHHKGGEIGRKSDKPSEGNFKRKSSSQTTESQNQPAKKSQNQPSEKKKDKLQIGPYRDPDKSGYSSALMDKELAKLKKKVRRHASGKNSVQKMKWQLKIRELEKNKKGN
jgi:hypothetical protein